MKAKDLLLAGEDNLVIGYLVLIHDQPSLAGGSDHREGVDRLMRRERLATMGEIVTQLAHEIRNPLVSIGATLEMLGKDGSGSGFGETMANPAKEITRMDMVLKDYLSLAARRNASVTRVDLIGQSAGMVRVREQIEKVASRSRRSPAVLHPGYRQWPRWRRRNPVRAPWLAGGRRVMPSSTSSTLQRVAASSA